MTVNSDFLYTHTHTHKNYIFTIDTKCTQFELLPCVSPLIMQTEPRFIMGWHSIVGVATQYGLDGPGIQYWWVRFSTLIQSEARANLASCTMGTRFLSWAKVAGAWH